MNLQLFIVFIIGIVVTIVVLRGVYRFFFVKSESGLCGGCSGCEFNPQQAQKIKLNRKL